MCSSDLVREQLHKMSGDIMRIVPSNGYLYEILLDHTTMKTGLWCDQWEDLFVHYGIDMYDEIFE